MSNPPKKSRTEFHFFGESDVILFCLFLWVYYVVLDISRWWNVREEDR